MVALMALNRHSLRPALYIFDGFFVLPLFIFNRNPVRRSTIRDSWENPFQIRCRAISFGTSRLVLKIRVMVPTYYRQDAWAYVPTQYSCHGGNEEMYLQHNVTTLKRVNTRFLFPKVYTLSIHVTGRSDLIFKLVYAIHPVFLFFFYIIISCILVDLLYSSARSTADTTIFNFPLPDELVEPVLSIFWQQTQPTNVIITKKLKLPSAKIPKL